MLSDRILTLGEVAEYLRVPESAIQMEISSGHLRATNVAGNHRIRESDLVDYLDGKRPKSAQEPEARESKLEISIGELSRVPDFTHTWPARKGETPERELFKGVSEGVVSYLGREHHVKVGFTFRDSAGKRRRRSLVLVDRYPTVEFVAADENVNGQMASIIRDRNLKQLPVGATLPSEYETLRVGPYQQVVNGPGAPHGMAVLCESQDIEAMVKHALIRYQFRQDRIQA
jgi:excisionase family DNA binding protein